MMLARLALAAALAVTPPVAMAETTVERAEPYDLLFRQGTLDGLDRSQTLTYDRTVQNSLAPDAEARDTGTIKLDIRDGADIEEAVLTFWQDERFRGLGEFPASVGNPMILYFVETVVRDMAESAGGSPFYIRNRVKEALVSPAEIETDGETVTVTMRPFADDPNAAQMRGFGDLALRVRMSDETPGWYDLLEATVPGTDGPVYASTMQFEGVE